MIKNLLSIIKAYKLTLIKIILYEVYFILRRSKGNSFDVRNDIKLTDNIPCPYFFLTKIEKFLKDNNLKFLVDLGCGGGRVIYYLNKKYSIKYMGIEYYEKTFLRCKNLFLKNKNVEIINNNFMEFDFSKIDNDCYFINDPLKDANDFNSLITNLIKINHNLNKLVYFILVNVEKNKLEILNKYQLIECLNIGNRGYFIFSNKEKLSDK